MSCFILASKKKGIKKIMSQLICVLMLRSNITIWVYRFFSSLGYGFIVGMGQSVLEFGHFYFFKYIYIYIYFK
jgi:hypothetical protein